MPAKVILTITQGSLQGQQYIFDSRTTCLIGRSSDCQIELPDDAAHRSISRYHCLVDITPPQARIRDFGSKNGTFVNGKKIGQRQANQTPSQGARNDFPEYDLYPGDEIQLSDTVFQVGVELEQEQSRTIDALKIAPEQKEIPAGFNLFAFVKNLLKQALAGEEKLLAIKGYQILSKLGEGGFGEVYLARHEQTGEEVALKVMLPQVAASDRNQQRFLREVENTKALHHSNVVALRDYGYFEEIFFFTLEYCPGGNVDQLIARRGGKLLISEAIPIILQTLEGLHYAHNAEIPYVKLAQGGMGKGKGLVHRDLKPSNILLTPCNNSLQAKVADYGLAKAFDLAGLSGLSMSGQDLGGTLVFMPRQQALNFKYAQPQVDVWAAAACLYYMLTGAYPRDFGDKDPFRTVLEDDPVPIRRRDSSIPKPLAELIDFALEDKPEIHFKTALEFKELLINICNISSI